MSNESNSNHQEEEDFSWAGCLTVLIIIGAALWALIHYNPSEEKHNDVIGEALVEAVGDGYVPSLSSAKAIKNIKYHSLGICSWTSTRYRGRTQLVTVGALGYVHNFINFEY